MKRGYRECPNCGTEHKISMKECGCGYLWDAKASDDQFYGCCEYMSGNERCHYQGVFKSSTDGSGKWYCRAHDRLPEAGMGHQIVMRSHFDIPKPDYSLTARRRAFVGDREPGQEG